MQFFLSEKEHFSRDRVAVVARGVLVGWGELAVARGKSFSGPRERIRREPRCYGKREAVRYVQTEREKKGKW